MSLPIRNTRLTTRSARFLDYRGPYNTVTIESTEIEEEGARELARLIRYHTLTLRSVALSAPVTAALCGNSSLTSLNLQCLRLPEECAHELSKCASLKKIVITCIDNNMHIVKAIRSASVALDYTSLEYGTADALALNTSIRELRVWKCEIQEKTLARISQSSSITDLHIESVLFSKAAFCFERNTTIKALRLINSHVKAEGAATLARNRTIETLDVSVNEIGDAGAEALALNATITELTVQNNEIGDLGVEALSKNTTLRSLWLRKNNVTSRGACALARNTSLYTLDVSYNSIGDEGAIALANNTALYWLSVKENGIRHDGIEALSKNTTLGVLDLSGNDLYTRSTQALASNTTLFMLDVTLAEEIAWHPFLDNTSLIELDLGLSPMPIDMVRRLLKNRDKAYRIGIYIAILAGLFAQ